MSVEIQGEPVEAGAVLLGAAVVFGSCNIISYLLLAFSLGNDLHRCSVVWASGFFLCSLLPKQVACATSSEGLNMYLTTHLHFPAEGI